MSRTRNFAEWIRQKMRREPKLAATITAEPTISSEAMLLADHELLDLDDAMCDRIWMVTSVRNEYGAAHIDEAEMRDLCGRVKQAAMQVIGTWNGVDPASERAE